MTREGVRGGGSRWSHLLVVLDLDYQLQVIRRVIRQSDFRYTFLRPLTQNFARTPHEVLLLEYRRSMGCIIAKACMLDNCNINYAMQSHYQNFIN